MLNEQLTLDLYRRVEPPPAVRRGPQVPMRSNTLLLGLGGFGGDSAIRSLARMALDGTIPLVGTLDTAKGARVVPSGPDGEPLPNLLPEGSHLYLDSGDRRARLAEHPLLAARYRRLLRGHWVAGSSHTIGGHGGGTQPLMTLIDLDLELRRVRLWLRGLLGRLGRGPQTPGGVLGSLLGRQEEPGSRPFVLVVAGGAGACGAGACLHTGYLIRQETQALGLGRPDVWLLLAGPHSFTGLTKRTLINYGATIEALSGLARSGVDRTGIDGTDLREGQPPYDRVWLMDDPRLPADGEAVTTRELEGFSQRVAAAVRAILHPEVRAAYLDRVANGESEAIWPGFGTIQIGQGGFAPALLEPVLAAELAHRRAAALAASLAPA